MLLKVFKKLFESKTDKLLRNYSLILEKINVLESKISLLSDDQIKSEFLFLKNNSSKSLDFILPVAYSIIREVSKRVLKMRHFDVQMLGGIALFYGKITEIATGEGKTLVATLPVCLSFLLGKRVHVITVNEYLANRDASWMYPIYNFLGLSVGVIVSSMTLLEKKKAYGSDVIYGTCNEFCFDYLRDNIVFSFEDKVQSGLIYAIIDEVDSILIDEARTPLIISLPDKVSASHYVLINNIIENLYYSDDFGLKNDFVLDFKTKNVYLTDNGFQKVEFLLKKYNLISENGNVYENSIELLHIVYASLKAKYFFKKDVDYVVDNFEIIIIDEHTGRLMEGRRWSDGLHQAIEAKEGLKVKSDNQTFASITFQNFFRLYEKLCGMTGTAFTEANEFEEIYGLEVLVIPTNKPNIRIDNADLIFLTKKAKYAAVLKDIESCYFRGQPVLVGTTSIDSSEFLSSLLKAISIRHNVLNAKYHEKESKIIAEAGRYKSITIATNMAGRGTDIVLGGSDEFFNESRSVVITLGGLKVIGTERHESRRIDNQLRGRCARQGDPGCTQFYVSLEDDLIKIFIGDKVLSFLSKLNISEHEVISSSLITKSIENAQSKVESYNFDVRKQLLEYDDIMNEQRRVFYHFRNSILVHNNFVNFISDVFFDLMSIYFDNKNMLNFNELINKFNFDFGFNLHIDTNDLNLDQLKAVFINSLLSCYNLKKQSVLNSDFFERLLFLSILDLKWREHLICLDHLRKGIHLRGYAQKDPKEEYKKEAFQFFESMLYDIKHEFVISFFRMSFDNFIAKSFGYQMLSFKHDSLSFNEKNSEKKIPFVNRINKVGRNDQCYCGSKKKYKYCHGKNF